MNELLQKLLEAEVLSEATKTELQEAFQVQLSEAVDAAELEASAEVRATLTEQWLEERDQLVEAIDVKINDFLQEEMSELTESVESFRDLEAEYANKIVEAKAEMGVELKSDLTSLVEEIDTFLEIRVNAEMQDLQEDIKDIRKNQFGRKIFEAFSNEFTSNYSSEDDAATTLAEAKTRLADIETALVESEAARDALTRTAKLNEVLSPLAGRQREVMEAILKTVATTDIEAGYKTFIGRVVRDTEEVDSGQEDKVLAESADVVKEGLEADLNAEVVTGDAEDLLNEEVEQNTEYATELAKLRKLAGI